MSQNCAIALIRLAREEVTPFLVVSDAHPWQTDINCGSLVCCHLRTTLVKSGVAIE